MKYAKQLLVGVLFGFILIKSEVVSWFRWQEMFRLDSFHIYGVIMSAVAFGALGLQLIKKLNIHDINGQPIRIADKDRSFARYALGGLIFGFGWALAGCPGSHYSLIGDGNFSIVFIVFSAVAGTWVYGMVRHLLPH